MAITDLTNTTWYVPSGWYLGYIGNIQFTGSIEYSGGKITCPAGSYIDYDMDEGIFIHPADGSNSIITLSPSNWFAISILSINDYPADFHQFIKTAGIQLKVTDLTNTTWNIPAGWVTQSGYGVYNIIGNVSITRYNGSVDDISMSGDMSGLALGYEADGSEWPPEWPGNNCIAFAPYEDIGDNSASFMLSINDGTDTTNPKLIAWLSKYGELQGGEEEPTTPTKKFTRLYIGEIVKTIGNKVFRKLSTVLLPSLTAPTVELSETTLNIYDEEGLATSYDILVDGEVKATVEVNTGVNITLNGNTISGGLEQAFVKFGFAPTSDDDFDYFVEAMVDGTDAYDGNGPVATRNITVSDKAYIWGYKYKLNDGNILTAGSTYSEATEITLINGDVLTLYSGNDD